MINERDHSHLAKMWINLPMRIQKHINLANGKPFPEWFSKKFEKKVLGVFDIEDTKHSFLKQLYIVSLCFPDEEGNPCMSFIDEYCSSNDSKKNAARAYDTDFSIALYPKEVLQRIQSINGNSVEEGKMEVLSKMMMFFHAARKGVKELQGI
jgi:hypothetical protein